jgi:hypothetical protein
MTSSSYRKEQGITFLGKLEMEREGGLHLDPEVAQKI